MRNRIKRKELPKLVRRYKTIADEVTDQTFYTLEDYRKMHRK